MFFSTLLRICGTVVEFKAIHDILFKSRERPKSKIRGLKRPQGCRSGNIESVFMVLEDKVINPALAQQLFRKSEMLKRKRAGEPAAVESFPRVVKAITSLWRHTESKKYLEELILVEGGKRRAGFPIEVQAELMFLYQLMLDQRRVLGLKGEKMTVQRPPGTRFTMGHKG